MCSERHRQRFEFRRTVTLRPVQLEVLQQAESALARLVARAYLADHLERRNSARKSGEHSGNNGRADKSL